MTELHTITDAIPVPEGKKLEKAGIINLLYKLEPGQSFLSKHYCSGSITLLMKTNPERLYTRRKDKESGLIRIWRVK